MELPNNPNNDSEYSRQKAMNTKKKIGRAHRLMIMIKIRRNPNDPKQQHTYNVQSSDKSVEVNSG